MKTIRMWCVGLVALGMLAAQVLPASALEITFTTQAAPPSITSSSPSNNAAGVSPYTSIDVLFTAEPGDNVKLYRNSDNSQVALSGVTWPGGFSWDDWGNPSRWEIRYTPLATLDSNTEYYMAIPASANFNVGGATWTFQALDQTGNDAQYWNSAHNQFEIHFTTAGGLTAVSADLGNGAGALAGQTNISVNATIKITTSNALDGTTVNATNCVLHEGSGTGTTVTAAVTLDSGDPTNKTIVVAPGAALKYSQTYTLVLSSVKDTLGQLLP